MWFITLYLRSTVRWVGPHMFFTAFWTSQSIMGMLETHINQSLVPMCLSVFFLLPMCVWVCLFGLCVCVSTCTRSTKTAPDSSLPSCWSALRRKPVFPVFSQERPLLWTCMIKYPLSCTAPSTSPSGRSYTLLRSIVWEGLPQARSLLSHTPAQPLVSLGL